MTDLERIQKARALLHTAGAVLGTLQYEEPDAVKKYEFWISSAYDGITSTVGFLNAAEREAK